MIRTRVAVIAAFAAATAAALTACGNGNGSVDLSKSRLAALNYTNGTAKDNNAPSNTGDFYSGPRNAPAAMKWVQLSAGAAGSLNPVVIDGAGFTLYRFDKDTASPSKSNCDGACATTWPPVLVNPKGRIFLDGVSKSKVGVVKRSDGKLQVTIGGWPIYRYSKDTAPGQTNGQGVGGTWFGVTPDGTKAGTSPEGSDSSGLNYKDGTARHNGAPSDTGDFYKGNRNSPTATKWVELTSGSANGLNPIVHDAAGFTLYRFDKDTASPSKSNCDGACAVTWPPVLVRPGSKIFVNGVPRSKVGVVKRTVGTLQVTIGGWPVYRFSKDTGPGQTNGEGVGGTWFAVSPEGQKVLPPTASTPTPAPTNGSGVTLGNGSVILDSGKNFTEPDGSVGKSGPGCVPVDPPFQTLSLQVFDGPIKIWTGPNCTGTSKVVDGNVPDLAALGFTQPIASIRFGD